MMMKKLLAVLFMFALVLGICGQSLAEIANPWREITEKEAGELCPCSFRAPSGAENVTWSVLDSAADPSGTPGALVQLCFDMMGYRFTAREQITGDTWSDASGMYYEWTIQDSITLRNWEDTVGLYYRFAGDNEFADLCLWYGSGTSYSLGVTAKDLDGFDLQAIAEGMSIQYDADAYEAAAQAVREEYIQVTLDGIDRFDEASHPELPWYTAALTRFPENRYYEGYYDFDGNGVPEMLVAAGDENNKTPIAVYAFDGQSMRYLCKEHPLGERSHLGRADGLFVVQGSGGAASGILAVYRIAEDGWSTDIVDVISYQYSDAEHVTYTPELGNISPDEVVSRGLASSFGLDVEVAWSCFYPAGDQA